MLFPFLHEIIKRDSINQRGKLIVLCGPGSYSAAPVFMSQLKLHTNVIFVGEPTGNAFNFFSDARTFGVTPHTGYTIRIATQYLDLNWPAKKDYSVYPHYPAVIFSDDYFRGVDPAFEAIKTQTVIDAETIFWKEGPRSALDYYKKINIYGWDADFFHSSSYQRCYEEEFHGYASWLIGKKEYDKAIDVLLVSVSLFPDAWYKIWEILGDASYKNGEILKAVGYFKKSLRKNPENGYAERMIREIYKELKRTGD